MQGETHGKFNYTVLREEVSCSLRGYLKLTQGGRYSGEGKRTAPTNQKYVGVCDIIPSNITNL